MSTETIENQIADLKKKQEQLKAREKALKAKLSAADRKARTKRLIEVGAVVEKALGIALDTPEKREAVLEVLTRTRRYSDGNHFTFAMVVKEAVESLECPD